MGKKEFNYFCLRQNYCLIISVKWITYQRKSNYRLIRFMPKKFIIAENFIMDVRDVMVYCELKHGNL